MREVDRPAIRPMHCAAIPFLGQTAEGERWIDTGSEMPGFDNHVYLSATAVRQCMSILGYTSPAEVEELRKALEDAEETAMGLLDQLKESKAALAASEVVQAYAESQAKIKA